MTIPRQRDRDWPVSSPPLSRGIGWSRLTMPCDIESRRRTRDRRAAWHADCPYPFICPCPQHAHDEEEP